MCTDLFGSVLMLFAVAPKLVGVDNVLPDDIKSRSYGCNRVEISLCHPDRKDGIFLSQALRTGHFIAEASANTPSNEELQAANHYG